MRRAIVTLIALLALFCAGLEGLTRIAYTRISHIRSRVEAERTAAMRVGTSAAGRHELLMVGNSLLKDDVDLPALKNALEPDVKITRFVVEDTTYWDWYYGLNKLLRGGARPETIVLVLSPRQLLSPAIQGDMFASVLMDRRDVLRVATTVGADRTTTSGLLLDTFSDFYGSRAEIRNFVLHAMLPKSEHLSFFLRPPASRLAEDDGTEALAAERLRAIKELAEQHGAHFVLAVPPLMTNEAIAPVLRAATHEQTAVLVPLAPGALPASSYSDGFHLNGSGAAVFTNVLARDLRAHLSLTTADTQVNSGSALARNTAPERSVDGR